MRKYATGLAVALVALMMTSASVNAGTYNGSADDFNFSLADDTPWGVPSAFGNTLFFGSAAFNVDSTSPDAVSGVHTSNGHVDITVNTPTGVTVTEVFVTAYGSFSLNGQGSKVDFSMDFDVTDIDTSASVSQAATPTPYTFPLVAGDNNVPNNVSDSFTAVNDLDISSMLGFDRENLLIGLSASTLADAGPFGNSASLDLNITSLELTFHLIPEPMTASMLICVGGCVLLRRRRN